MSEQLQSRLRYKVEEITIGLRAVPIDLGKYSGYGRAKLALKEVQGLYQSVCVLYITVGELSSEVRQAGATKTNEHMHVLRKLNSKGIDF